MTAYIVKMLRERMSPHEIIKEVEPVLDSDAEMFVVKMWRMLLFEVLRADSL